MTATQKLLATTQTERQIQRLGIGPWALTPEAVELFARRQRRRGLVMLIAGSAALAVYLTLFLTQFSVAGHPTHVFRQQYSFRVGVATAFFGFAMLVQGELTRHLDRRFASTLAIRVSRAAKLPLLAIIGGVRIIFLLVVLTGQVVMAVAFFAVAGSESSAFCWGFLAALLACTTSVSIGIARVVRRPALAVDDVSLTIDERMRSEEALSASSPLMFLAVVGNGAVFPLGLPPLIFQLGIVTTGASYVMWLWAQSAKPWPKPGPAPWLEQAARSAG